MVGLVLVGQQIEVVSIPDRGRVGVIEEGREFIDVDAGPYPALANAIQRRFGAFSLFMPESIVDSMDGFRRVPLGHGRETLSASRNERPRAAMICSPASSLPVYLSAPLRLHGLPGAVLFGDSR